jgi:hypothetical protein
VMGPGVASECVETKDGPVGLGGSLLSGDHRPRHRRGPARRRGGRARLHDAHQGSAAGDPLPHARPDAASCRRPRARCAAWARSSAAATTC